MALLCISFRIFSEIRENQTKDWQRLRLSNDGATMMVQLLSVFYLGMKNPTTGKGCVWGGRGGISKGMNEREIKKEEKGKAFLLFLSYYMSVSLLNLFFTG